MGRGSIGYRIYTITYLSFALLIVLPIAWTLLSVFFTEGSLNDNLGFLDKKILLLLGKSALLAFLVALFSTLLGTMTGFLLNKTNVVFRGFFKVSLLIPLFISPYILSVAWKDFFFLVFGNSGFISSFFGVGLVLTTIYTPLSMIITGSALSNINKQLEESGFMITNFRRVSLKITLPLIKPALISSFVLIFIFSISEFSVPAFFGVKVFTTEIFTQFSAFYNHSMAILQSSLLILICILLLFTEGKYLAEAPFLSVGSKGTSNKTYNIKNGFGLLFLSGWLSISVALPFITLFIQSFKGGTDKIIQAVGLLKPTFANSIGLAFTGALIITFIGFVAAYGTRTKKGTSFDWLLLVVFAIPSTIFGISLIKFYNHSFLDVIYSGYAIILIGYAGKFSFIAARLIGNAMKQLPDSLDEAAQIEGISEINRLRKITIPLIIPSLFAAFIISFIFSLGELGTTIMVYPPGTEIMPIKVFTIMANAPQSLTSSMTLIVFSVTLLIIIGFYFLAKPLVKDHNSYVQN